MSPDLSGKANFRYGIISLLLSAAAILIIVYKWNSVQYVPDDNTVIVRNQNELKELLNPGNFIKLRTNLSNEKIYRIPTGYFIQSLKFVSSTDVNLNGYIWQKYPQDFPKNFQKGIIFPEEVGSANTQIREIYRDEVKENNVKHQLIGWYFDVTVRQNFDYSNYPLDLITVWLKIWAKDFVNDDRIVLVPDFDAYLEKNNKIHGLDENIVPGEWDISETFFSYSKTPYDMNFGFIGESKKVSEENFLINIVLKRKFINAFIINLVPLFLVAVLLFAQIMINSTDEDKASRFGFSTSGVVGACSALFFAVLLSHTQVRGLFAGSPLVYLEYFYLIMYLAIVITALNSYFVSLQNSRFANIIQYKDNLIIKAAFIPFVFWFMAIATCIKI